MPNLQEVNVIPGLYYLYNNATNYVVGAQGDPCVTPNFDTCLTSQKQLFTLSPNSSISSQNASRIIQLSKMPSTAINSTEFYLTVAEPLSSLPKVITAYNGINVTWKPTNTTSIMMGGSSAQLVMPVAVSNFSDGGLKVRAYMIQEPDQIVFQPVDYPGWFFGICDKCDWILDGYKTIPVVLMKTTRYDPRVIFQAIQVNRVYLNITLLNKHHDNTCDLKKVRSNITAPFIVKLPKKTKAKPKTRLENTCYYYNVTAT